MKRSLVVAGAALLVVLVTGRIVKAFNPQPDPPALFGMIGITPVDTMQLNIVNVELSGVPPGPLQGDTEILEQQWKYPQTTNCHREANSGRLFDNHRRRS